MDELNPQYADDGPIVVASHWVDAVLKRHDLAAGWLLMDVSLRRKAVRGWIDANSLHPALLGFDSGSLCEELASDDPTEHPLWGGYAVTQMREFHETFDHLDVEHCGFGSIPRPIAPDLELLLFLDTGSPAPAIVAGPPEQEVWLPGFGFVMRHLSDGGWVIDGFRLGATAEEISELKCGGDG